MDRRQRKTRNAIFSAFSALLSDYSIHQITVGQIIERADVGRTTFYAHFETKEMLLRALCGELFTHIFESASGNHPMQRIFDCEAPDSVFLHLLQHLQKNDNNILRLLSGRNGDVFWQYFREELKNLIVQQKDLFSGRKAPQLPEDYWLDHISGVFIQTVKWWIDNKMTQTPEEITQYFLLAV